MSDREPGPISPAEDVWPPPPRGWEGAEGGVRVEQVEVWQDRDRLTLRNRRARHLLIFGGCAAFFVTLLPLPLSLVFPNNPTPHTFWAYVASVYRPNHYRLLWMALLECVGLGVQIWIIYDRHLHRGQFVLDKRGGAIRAGGGQFCLMSELDHVLIRRAYGKCLVYFMRTDGEKSPKWNASVVRVPRNACLVSDFRQQVSAEDVAGIVAEFAGVPVRYQAGAENSV